MSKFTDSNLTCSCRKKTQERAPYYRQLTSFPTPAGAKNKRMWQLKFVNNHKHHGQVRHISTGCLYCFCRIVDIAIIFGIFIVESALLEVCLIWH